MDSSQMKTAQVKTVHAVCPGRYHGFVQSDCQDQTASFYSPSTGATSVVLCDGAGGALYPKQAARFQADFAARFLALHFEQLYAEQDAASLIRRVLQHGLLDYAEQTGLAYEELCATVVAVAVCEGRWLTFHIGDGVIFSTRFDGSVQLLSGPENGERLNITSFVCDPLLGKDSFRVARGPLDGVAGFLLSSDGLSAFLCDSKPLVAELISHFSQGDTGEELASSVRVLAESQVTSDDCSLALLCTRPHLYPECLKELSPARAEALRRIANGVQPSSRLLCGKKKRARLHRLCRFLCREGYLGRDLYGHYFVFREDGL